MITPHMHAAIDEIIDERRRQEDYVASGRHRASAATANVSDMRRLAIIVEELAEVASEMMPETLSALEREMWHHVINAGERARTLNDHHYRHPAGALDLPVVVSTPAMRGELVQLAATVVAWIEGTTTDHTPPAPILGHEVPR